MSRLIAAAGARLGHLAFREIDDAAKDGSVMLLRDENGHQHCGQWSRGAWRYTSGAEIARVITHYCARRQVEADPAAGEEAA